MAKTSFRAAQIRWHVSRAVSLGDVSLPTFWNALKVGPPVDSGEYLGQKLTHLPQKSGGLRCLIKNIMKRLNRKSFV